MKYIFILLITLFICGCQIKEVSNIPSNYKEIRFIKDKNSISILINHEDNITLLELTNKDKIYTSRDNVKVDNLVVQSNIISDVNCEKKYILNKEIVINDLSISKTDKIIINLNNYNICVYDKNISNNDTYSICNFIYILNNEENVYITLNDNVKALFYNEYVNFTSKFLEHIYLTWVDTYIISETKITKLVLEENNYYIE